MIQKRKYINFLFMLFLFTLTFLFNIHHDQSFAEENSHMLLDNNLPALNNSDIQNDLPEGKYYISTSYNSNLFLDVQGGGSANCQNIEVWSRNTEISQQFYLSYDDKGYAMIKNLAGKYLDVSGSLARSTANVIQFEKTGNINQKWIILKNGNSYSIKSALSVNKKNELFLDVAGSSNNRGANVQIFSKNNSSNQKFNFISFDSKKIEGDNVIEDGNYYIKMFKSKNTTIEIPSSSVASSANVSVWSYHGSQNQIFHFTYEEKTKCYLIYNVCSGLVLNVKGSSPFPEANVIQFNENSDENSRWAIYKNNDGSFRLVNRSNALSLDLCACSYKNGSNIQTFTKHNGDSQKFVIEKAPLLNKGLYTIKPHSSHNSFIEIPQSSWSEGKQLQIFNNNYCLNQKFYIKQIDDNFYQIRSLTSGMLVGEKSGKVVQLNTENDSTVWEGVWGKKGFGFKNKKTSHFMCVSNNKLITKIDFSSANESFFCVSTDMSTVATYNIVPACSTNNCLNTRGGSWYQGEQVFSWPGLSDTNSRWRIESVGNNLFRIVSSKTDYVLDVRNGACHDGDTLQQYSWNGGSPQLWTMQFTDDGWFVLKNITSGLVMDLAGSSSSAGASVGVCKYHGGTNQKWRFVLTDPVVFSGNNELDSHLRSICRGCPDLQSAYNFVVGFPYRSGDLWPGGYWTIDCALDMIHNWSGNCYRYAALFMWIARALGYSCDAFQGWVNTNIGQNPHGWCEVYLGGTYVCDCELQREIPSRNFYMTTYDTAPVYYVK